MIFWNAGIYWLYDNSATCQKNESSAKLLSEPQTSHKISTLLSVLTSNITVAAVCTNCFKIKSLSDIHNYHSFKSLA